MFNRQLFEIFHDGYWYGHKQPPAPTWHLVAPALSDTHEIINWKVREFSLPVREEGRPGRGIPMVGGTVADPNNDLLQARDWEFFFSAQHFRS
jgi:hypothetical protein